jgi:hypothetical protein
MRGSVAASFRFSAISNFGPHELLPMNLAFSETARKHQSSGDF